MVTRGPLLPLWGAGWHEYRYLCATCGRQGRVIEQYVAYGPEDDPPRVQGLACFIGTLDTREGLARVQMHIYVLAEPGKPAGDEQDGGSQGAGSAGPRSGAQRP